jgi:hypothetical protein
VFHTYCLNIFSQHPALDIFGSSGIVPSWRCSNCTLCQRCNISHNVEEILILCDQCDACFHLHCCNPPLSQLPPHGFRCDRCMQCKKCGTKDSTDGWNYDNEMCMKCSIKMKKKEYCNVCEKVWGSTNEPTIRCAKCNMCQHKSVCVIPITFIWSFTTTIAGRSCINTVCDHNARMFCPCR